MPKKTPHSALFILSHMRSYSSVLSHVLGSHPQIDGYCETHLRYRFSFDLLRLKWRVRRLTGEPLRGRYVLDKILHNYAVATAILENPNTRAIILLRQPVDVVQSIVHMGRHLDVNEQNANVANATMYYIERLSQLAQFARAFGKRAAFVESETLMARTDETLAFLQDFLGLDSPLERRYRSFSKTGKPGYGDPSEMIHSGEIGSRRDEQRPHYSIPPALLAQAVTAHSECLSACRQNCAPVSAMGEGEESSDEGLQLAI
ncbi:MAG: sulfotransferase [Gammaproteobacteria bacterium]